MKKKLSNDKKRKKSSRRRDKKNGSVDGKSILSELQKSLDNKKQTIERKKQEIKEILENADKSGETVSKSKASKNRYSTIKERDHESQFLEKKNDTPDTSEPEVVEGPIAENILRQKRHGKRITLKDRILIRQKETREMYPDGVPEKEYFHFEKIPEISQYLLQNNVKVDGYRENYFHRILKKRLIRLRYNSYREYYKFLKNNPSEIATFRDSLSINVTRFFRNREVWEYIKHDIFTHLTENLTSDYVKIWSAGCAIGAEPYSLAMILNDIGNKISKLTRFNILATDIKDELLSTALEGTYFDEHLSELTEKEIHTYFTEDGNNYLIKSYLKKMVKFDRLDLVSDPYPQNLDLIVCRNVLIYIDNRAKEKIFEKFFHSLNSGGFLIIGKSESLLGDWREQVETYSINHRVYRKL